MGVILTLQQRLQGSRAMAARTPSLVLAGVKILLPAASCLRTHRAKGVWRGRPSAAWMQERLRGAGGVLAEAGRGGGAGRGSAGSGCLVCGDARGGGKNDWNGSHGQLGLKGRAFSECWRWPTRTQKVI